MTLQTSTSTGERVSYYLLLPYQVVHFLKLVPTKATRLGLALASLDTRTHTNVQNSYFGIVDDVRTAGPNYA
jgi:hypothetical protein